MSPRQAAEPAAARTAPAGMFHSAINILIRELSTHLANPVPRRDHVVSGGETPGVADVGDAHEPPEPTRNTLETTNYRQPASLLYDALRVGQECVLTFHSRVWPSTNKKNI